LRIERRIRHSEAGRNRRTDFLPGLHAAQENPPLLFDDRDPRVVPTERCTDHDGIARDADAHLEKTPLAPHVPGHDALAVVRLEDPTVSGESEGQCGCYVDRSSVLPPTPDVPEPERSLWIRGRIEIDRRQRPRVGAEDRVFERDRARVVGTPVSRRYA
jgi:hypothetical protein